MSNNSDFTTVTVKIKKQYYDGKPCCYGCHFHHHTHVLYGDFVYVCSLLDVEIGSAYDLKGSFTPLKTCPVHYPEATKELPGETYC